MNAMYSYIENHNDRADLCPIDSDATEAYAATRPNEYAWLQSPALKRVSNAGLVLLAGLWLQDTYGIERNIPDSASGGVSEVELTLDATVETEELFAPKEKKDRNLLF
jgi:hypothetical protein